MINLFTTKIKVKKSLTAEDAENTEVFLPRIHTD